MPMQNVIDLDHLEKYVAGDDALRDEILTLFAERAVSMNAELKATQTEEERKLTLHTLKGGARGVGAWVLGDLCEQAERMNDNPEKSAEQAVLMADIEKAVSDVADAVQMLRKAA